MKVIKISLLILTILVLIAPSMVVAQDHHHSGAIDMCEDVTQEIHIATDEFSNKYNATEFKVEKGACVMIMFENKATTEHDFNLANETSDSWVHMHLDNNTDPTFGMSGIAMAHVQFPDKDITLDFYCTIEGHRGDGMKGTIVVGAGSDDKVPFEFAPVLAAFLVLGIAIPLIKKRRN